MVPRSEYMTHFLKIVLLGAALVAVAPSQDRRDQPSHDQQQTKRYYDKTRKDYHEWNQDEDRRYHEYLKERRMQDRNFDRLNSRQQSDYFKWRHQHEQNGGDRDDRHE